MVVGATTLGTELDGGQRELAVCHGCARRIWATGRERRTRQAPARLLAGQNSGSACGFAAKLSALSPRNGALAHDELSPSAFGLSGPLIYRCASRWGLFFLVSCRVWFSVPRPLVGFSGLPTPLLRPGSNCLLPWAACIAPRGGSLLAMVLASLPATEGMW